MPAVVPESRVAGGCSGGCKRWTPWFGGAHDAMVHSAWRGSGRNAATPALPSLSRSCRPTPSAAAAGQKARGGRGAYRSRQPQSQSCSGLGGHLAGLHAKVAQRWHVGCCRHELPEHAGMCITGLHHHCRRRVVPFRSGANPRRLTSSVLRDRARCCASWRLLPDPDRRPVRQPCPLAVTRRRPLAAAGCSRPLLAVALACARVRRGCAWCG